METDVHCSARVYHSHVFTSSHCTKKVTVTRDGKPYCTIHDPEHVKAASEARFAKWNAGRAEKDRQNTKNLAYLVIAKVAIEQAHGSGDMNPIIEAVRIWEELP